MTTITTGDLIGFKKDSDYYYYLVLSEPLYYGCRWSYAFHKKSDALLSRNELLNRKAEGFQALIDFKTKLNQKYFFKIGEGIDIEPFQVKVNSKVRIDKPGGGHEWYIFNPQLQILKKQQKLKTSQSNFPIASGITCDEANLLVDKKWRTGQVVEEEGRGQFPIEKKGLTAKR